VSGFSRTVTRAAQRDLTGAPDPPGDAVLVDDSTVPMRVAPNAVFRKVSSASADVVLQRGSSGLRVITALHAETSGPPKKGIRHIHQKTAKRAVSLCGNAFGMRDPGIITRGLLGRA